MISLYDDKEAKRYKTDLDLRVYTSRLLGQESSLVLHGGGNTSVKSTATNLFLDEENILYVKGSGWDLATIKAQGFAPVKMEMLLKMAELKELKDTDMVKYQRLAMTNPSAPNPSVEAILHAIIPFKFVDHTHADAIVSITNTQGGEEKIKELYGDKVFIVPYIMPGFALAKLIYDMTRDLNFSELEGMVLMNHGLFTFSDDAKKSYEKTIELVDKAEKYLQNNASLEDAKNDKSTLELLELANIRAEVSKLKKYATISILNDSNEAINFSKQDIEKISQQGPLTPDHVIRTKRVPIILKDDVKMELNSFVEEYKRYFEKNKKDETLLNPAPNFAILKNNGSLSFGKNTKEANIIKDINEHTFEAILKAEKLGGYRALSAAEIFEVEYWSLEQAKLKKSGTSLEFEGRVAVITGGASDMGRSIAQMLNEKGAAVVVLDVDAKVETIFNRADAKGVRCDMTSSSDIKNAIELAVKSFGGIDMLVSCENSSSHKLLMKQISPFLKLGIDVGVVIVSVKNDDTEKEKLRRYYVGKDYAIDDNQHISSSLVKIETISTNVAELVSVMLGNAFFKTRGVST
ncbi:MAG: SDR family NAD(P)-dependent oxidoreductase [Sulfurimonas sp.]|nr:SDR family NAD(P)-dependent oxidoreductase [Sulfurimonas sp.]